MSLDNALRSIAFSEARTLSGAVALIAKHRNDLAAAMRAADLKAMPVVSEGAATERALNAIQPPPTPGGHVVDKLA